MNALDSGIDEGVRLLIVDDHGLLREGLLALCGAASGVEAATAGAEESLWMVRQFAPGVVLINADLSDADPVQTAREILGCRPAPRVLFLARAVSSAQLRRAVESGAHGYWTSRASFDQLLEAVRRVAAGQLSFCPVAQQYLVPTARGVEFRQAEDCGALSALTAREIQVLGLLVEGLTVKDCAKRLGLSPSTIDNHKSRMMRKLGVHKVVDLVRVALREGLTWE